MTTRRAKPIDNYREELMGHLTAIRQDQTKALEALYDLKAAHAATAATVKEQGEQIREVKAHVWGAVMLGLGSLISGFMGFWRK